MLELKGFPLTYLITEGKLTPKNFHREKVKILQIIRLAVEINVSLVQIREKHLPTRIVYEFTKEVIQITKASSTKVLVNDRADIALAALADGVHLTSNSLPTKEIRDNFPSDFLIGVSTHTPEKALTAKKEGADFVTYSPIFPTTSKSHFVDPLGVKKLHNLCDLLGAFPVIALGGINEKNYKSTLEYGAKGFASIGFLNNLENLRKLKL